MQAGRSRILAGVATTLLLMGVIAGCGGGDAGDPTGRTWTLVELGSAPAVEGTLVTLTFSDGQISGSGGCNSYTGSAVWGEDGTLSVDPAVATTLMACEPPVMDQETAFFAMLAEAAEFRVDGDELVLSDDGGTAVARFTAAAP